MLSSKAISCLRVLRVANATKCCRRRLLSSPSTGNKPLTVAEEAQLREANEKMKDYFTNRPALKVLEQAKRRSKVRDSEHTMQLAIVSLFLSVFVVTPFLGQKIALDPEFRKFVPSWYDFSIEKPESKLSRAELHEQIIAMQQQLHERAIRGDFSKENLDKLRRHFDGADDPERSRWGKLDAPGDDDDDDDEDD